MFVIAIFISGFFLFSCQKPGKMTDVRITGIDGILTYYENKPDFTKTKPIIPDSIPEICTRLNYSSGLARARLLQGQYYYDHGEFEKAMGIIQDIETLINDLADSKITGRYYFLQGLINTSITNYDDAFNFLVLALERFEDAEEQKLVSLTLSKIGLLFWDKNEPEKAIEYLRQAFDLSVKLNDSTGIARELNNIALAFRQQNKLDSVRGYYERAIRINKATGNNSWLARNVANLGNLLKDKSEYKVSEQYLKRALFIADSIGDVFTYGRLCNNVGDLYLRIKEYDSAKYYYQVSKGLNKKNNDLASLMIAHQGLYHCFRNLNMNDSALIYCESFNQLEDSLNRVDILHNLARQELKYNLDRQHREKESRQSRLVFIFIFSIIILLLSLTILVLNYRRQKLKIKNKDLEKKVLQSELETKNRELTSYVLNMIRFNERKMGVIRNLKKVKPMLTKDNQTVIEDAVNGLQTDNDAHIWKEFEVRFNQVHHQFYMKLSSRFPDLTLNEKRLCAFLLMDMTTKEISSLTGQSPRAIDMARIRLRKKLGLLNQNISISSFLMEL